MDVQPPGEGTRDADTEQAVQSTQNPHPSTTAHASLSDSPAGGFLFVNRHKQTIGLEAYSRDVCIHVQQTYRAQSGKKPGSSSKLKPASGVPAKTMRVPRRGGEILPWTVGRRRRRWRASFPDHLKATQTEQWAPAPGSPLQQGNSDPFKALPFAVTPITNRLLSWFRDDGMPSLFPFERAVLGDRMPAVQGTWRSAVACMQSQSLAHSLLASISALMSRLTRSDVIHQLALRLKQKSYNTLRVQLERGEDVERFETWRMMLDLFWAERNTGCESAAEVHLVPMARSLKTRDPSALDDQFRAEFLAATVVLAGISNVAPLIDTRKWARERRHEDWRAELDYQERTKIELEMRELHEVVTDVRLRLVIINLRELVATAELVLDGRIRSKSVFAWLNLRMLSAEGELLTLAHEYGAEKVEEAVGNSSPGQGLRIRHCTCLTAMAWVSATFAKRNRCKKQALASRLRVAQTLCEFDTDGNAGRQSLALWSYYVGSLLEKAMEDEAGVGSHDGWHFTQFVRQVSRACEGGCPEVPSHLRRFLHSSVLKAYSLS